MYPLSHDLIDFLLSEPAGAALAELRTADVSDGATLTLLEGLRRRFSAAQAAVLLDQARLRRKARAKFPDADRLFFTADALQQASSRAVAAYRAGRFAAFAGVADLGCGIGGDTLALAEAVPHVFAVERDPLRARLAAANVTARGLESRVTLLCADWTACDLPTSAAFADPGRRVTAGGATHRVFDLEAMDPPLAVLLGALARLPHLAVKTMPGIAHADVPAQAEVEFISEAGEMKEALLLFGNLRTGGAPRGAPRATLLPGPHHLEAAGPEPEAALSAPRAYLYEPDPAVLRAGLVRTLAARLGAAQLDADIAYLTADESHVTPFARCWRVMRHGSFHLKTLNCWLREAGAGEVIVKKRGSPVDPDEFRRRLKTIPGGARLTVFLTQVQERPWMVLCETGS